jgi:hypothetical protein
VSLKGAPMGKKRLEFLCNSGEGKEPSRNLVIMRKSDVFMTENMEYKLVEITNTKH